MSSAAAQTGGYDFIDNDYDATDCNGHGTHVAGTIGGSTYGVAKNVNVVGVRVLNCSGSGSNSGVIAGINWVKNNASGLVANMSLRGGASQTHGWCRQCRCCRRDHLRRRSRQWQ